MFAWNTVSNAHHYDVWVNAIINGQETIGNPVLRNSSASGTSWTPTTALSRGRTYRWYIGAVSTNGTTFWSEGVTFFVVA